MSNPSKRQQIIAAIVARLEGIRTELSEDFATDAGDVVVAGFVPTPGPDDRMPRLAVQASDDVTGSQLKKAVCTMSIEIFVIARVDMTAGDPAQAIEDGISDVKRAVELEDRTLGGLLPSPQSFRRVSVRTAERESGSPVVGAVVAYAAEFTEIWGHPDQ